MFFLTMLLMLKLGNSSGARVGRTRVSCTSGLNSLDGVYTYGEVPPDESVATPKLFMLLFFEAATTQLPALKLAVT